MALVLLVELVVLELHQQRYAELEPHLVV
jgi:hypothetical protein